VLADLSGVPEKPLPPIAKRKFVQIDRDNVDDVMKKIGPRLAFKVDNRLSEDDTKLNVELRFQSMEDFQPAKVARGKLSWFTRGLRRAIKLLLECLPLPKLWRSLIN